MYLVAAARVALSGDLYLAVAQLGSAPARGAGGRRFKSCQPDTRCYLGERGYDDAEEVISIEERTEYSCGCSTCSFEYQVLDVRYRTLSGEHKTVVVEDSLSSLLGALLNG